MVVKFLKYCICHPSTAVLTSLEGCAVNTNSKGSQPVYIAERSRKKAVYNVRRLCYIVMTALQLTTLITFSAPDVLNFYFFMITDFSLLRSDNNLDETSELVKRFL
jgi:hypothetical protein